MLEGQAAPGTNLQVGFGRNASGLLNLANSVWLCTYYARPTPRLLPHRRGSLPQAPAELRLSRAEVRVAHRPARRAALERGDSGSGGEGSGAALVAADAAAGVLYMGSVQHEVMAVASTLQSTAVVELRWVAFCFRCVDVWVGGWEGWGARAPACCCAHCLFCSAFWEPCDSDPSRRRPLACGGLARPHHACALTLLAQPHAAGPGPRL